MIRTATEADLPEMIEIERSSFGPDLAWSPDDLQSSVRQGRVVVFPWYDGRIVGYCSFKVRGEVGTVDSVAVHRSWRGFRVGERLIWHALAAMSETKCVELDCDEALYGYYRKKGFAACGHYTSGVGPKQASRFVMRCVPWRPEA